MTGGVGGGVRLFKQLECPAEHIVRSLERRLEGEFDKVQVFREEPKPLAPPPETPKIEAQMPMAELGDSFDGLSGGLSAQGAMGLCAGGGVGGASAVAAPSPSSCPCPEKFAQPANTNFGEDAAPAPAPPDAQMKEKRLVSEYETFLRKNPFERQETEMALGGRFVGMNESRFQLEPFAAGEASAGPHKVGAAANVHRMIDRIQEAGEPNAHRMGADDKADASPAELGFQGMMMTGFQRFQSPNAAGPDAVFGANEAFGARPFDRGMPSIGAPQGDGGAAFQAILNDDSLSFEDKLMLLLFEITKDMDDEIKREKDRIAAMNHGQAPDQMRVLDPRGPIGGEDDKTMETRGPENRKVDHRVIDDVDPSANDEEAAKMQRLLEKRGQMFGTLDKLIGAFDQTNKGVLQELGRS